MTTLLITSYHNTQIAAGEGGREADPLGVRYPLAMLPGSALRQSGGCAPPPGLNSAPAETSKTADHQERDLIHKFECHLLPKLCTLGKGVQAFPGAPSQELPGISNIQWEEARTYVFARYTHGSPLLHLAGLHNYTHHYWVTRVENELREYFHLARKYGYVPGR